MGFRRIPLDLFEVRGWVPRPWGETRRAAAILTTHSFIKVIIILYLHYLDVAHSLDMRAHVLSYFTEAAAVQRLVDRLSGVGDPRAGLNRPEFHHVQALLPPDQADWPGRAARLGNASVR